VTTATAKPASRLRCPHCGTRLAPDQDWCLECGAAATTRFLRPPNWKLRAAIVTAVVAAFVVVVAIMVDALSGDADHTAATRARVPAASATARATPKPAPAATPASPTTGGTAATPAHRRGIATWPSRRAAWTVVLATASSRAAAERRARDLIAKRVKAGVLDTAKFAIDASGAAFVVFTGQFRSQDAAVAEETRLGDKAPTAVFVAQVSPR
jgi:hypothetical protein